MTLATCAYLYFATAVLSLNTKYTTDRKLYQVLSRSVNFRVELPDICILNKPVCACAVNRVHNEKCSSKVNVSVSRISRRKCIVYVGFSAKNDLELMENV